MPAAAVQREAIQLQYDSIITQNHPNRHRAASQATPGNTSTTSLEGGLLPGNHAQLPNGSAATPAAAAP